MKIISHRGNLEGSDLLKENNPDQIKKVLNLGFDVEIDMWLVDNKEFLLGHDKPIYSIYNEFLKIDRIWCHCKNLEVLRCLLFFNYGCNYFWHQEDDFTLTNKNYVWTYPGKELTDRSILVLPEQNNINYQNIKDKNIYGVCTDYPIKWRKEIGKN